MSWAFDENLPWIGQSKETVANNLARLVLSNPVVKNSATRPLVFEHDDIRVWLCNLGYAFICDKRSSYHCDVEFQKRLMIEITDWISKAHYRFLLNRKPTRSMDVQPAQFWTPPSYLVCYWRCDTEGNPQYLKMHFLTEPFFSYEFYGPPTPKDRPRCHPAIVVLSDDLAFGLVPISHRKGSPYVRFHVLKNDLPDEGVSFARCGLFFKATESILEESDFEERWSIKQADFENVRATVIAKRVRL